MADEQKPQEGTEQEPHGAPPETDWKAEARKWEARAKENKAKADAYDEAQEAAKSDLQKAQERIAQLEQEKDERAKKDEHAALVKKVMAEQKVDAKYASLLTAATEEDLVAQAKLIGERFADPVVTEGGKPPQVGDKDAEMKAFAHSLFSGSRQ